MRNCEIKTLNQRPQCRGDFNTLVAIGRGGRGHERGRHDRLKRNCIVSLDFTKGNNEAKKESQKEKQAAEEKR